jgi:hypothetical protein
MKPADPNASLLAVIQRKGYYAYTFTGITSRLDYTQGSGVLITKEPDMFTLDDNPLLNRGNESELSHSTV